MIAPALVIGAVSLYKRRFSAAQFAHTASVQSRGIHPTLAGTSHFSAAQGHFSGYGLKNSWEHAQSQATARNHRKATDQPKDPRLAAAFFGFGYLLSYLGDSFY